AHCDTPMGARGAGASAARAGRARGGAPRIEYTDRVSTAVAQACVPGRAAEGVELAGGRRRPALAPERGEQRHAALDDDLAAEVRVGRPPEAWDRLAERATSRGTTRCSIRSAMTATRWRMVGSVDAKPHEVS